MPNNYNDVVKQNKKYLTKAQVNSLAAASKAYGLQNAGTRAGALAESREQYDTAYRGLQNIGLAGNPNAAPASGEVPRLQTQVEQPLQSFNQRLMDVENRRLSALGSAYKKQTVAARAAAYAARQKALAEQQAKQQAAVDAANKAQLDGYKRTMQLQSQMAAQEAARQEKINSINTQGMKQTAYYQQQINDELNKLRAAAAVQGIAANNTYIAAETQKLTRQYQEATAKEEKLSSKKLPSLNQKTGECTRSTRQRVSTSARKRKSTKRRKR